MPALARDTVAVRQHPQRPVRRQQTLAHRHGIFTAHTNPWLLWLLGFSATRIGGTGKMSDAPDLIAATPMGNLVVIECTTGILKEDSNYHSLSENGKGSPKFGPLWESTSERSACHR